MNWYIKCYDKDSNRNPRYASWWKLSTNEFDENGFDENYDEVIIFNDVGGRCTLPYFDFDVDSIVQAESSWDLDWSNTWADPKLRKWEGNGWLSSSGKLYPCDWMEHDHIAIYFFKKDSIELEQEGWLKVHRNTPVGSMYVNRITREQWNTLNRNEIPHIYEEEDVTMR